MRTVDLAWTSWGNPHLQSILLVHGLGGCARIWQPLASLLADRYYLVAPDLRGHGASPVPGSYTADELLADLSGFVEARRLEKFVIVGHSFGGLLATEYAVRNPAQVEALISMDINIPPLECHLDHLRRAVAKPHPVFATREDAIDYMRRTVAPAATQEILEAVTDALLVANGSGHLTLNFDREVLRHAVAFAAIADLTRVQCPAIFLRGSDSVVMDRAGGIEMLHRLESARLVQIPRAGHFVFLDNPQVVAQEVRLFLSSDASRAS